ncbi:hypothetical protein B0H14DRAFT_2590234 [Mycena olivaceomarginata]|nr:hypothetical protein B0H14DRAFT_2590234 [Mycena olivaceomarginata]
MGRKKREEVARKQWLTHSSLEPWEKTVRLAGIEPAKPRLNDGGNAPGSCWTKWNQDELEEISRGRQRKAPSIARPREASAKDDPENSSNLASKSHSSLVSGPGKATFWTRVITCLLGKIFQKMSRKFEKITSPGSRLKKPLFRTAVADFWPQKATFRTRKSPNLGLKKPLFSDHPLGELPGASIAAMIDGTKAFLVPEQAPTIDPLGKASESLRQLPLHTTTSSTYWPLRDSTRENLQVTVVLFRRASSGLNCVLAMPALSSLWIAVDSDCDSEWGMREWHFKRRDLGPTKRSSTWGFPWLGHFLGRDGSIYNFTMGSAESAD